MGNEKLKKAGGGGNRVLESRHLVGLFLGVVVLCSVFFTLGYVMGRTQYDASVRAASSASKEKATPPAASKASAEAARAVPGLPAAGGPFEWEFYRSGQAKKADVPLNAPENAAAASQPQATPSHTSENSAAKAALKAPVVPRGLWCSRWPH